MTVLHIPSAPSVSSVSSVPSADCPLCPRLAAWRDELRHQHPTWHNAPVGPFGDPDARLVIIGLAPGLQGANRTGRPFTGDGAGALLYGILAEMGLANGSYAADAGDGLALQDVMVVNAVRCVPPKNRPTAAEIRTCRQFLEADVARLPNARVFLALGEIAHRSAVKLLGGKLPKLRFQHGAVHRVPDGRLLVDSYHCSRYNQNTGRLTSEMLRDVLQTAVDLAAGRNADCQPPDKA